MSNNLLRTEAQARARAVADVAYEVELDLTRGPEGFLSTTRITFRSTQGATTFLDLIASRVLSVELNGEPLDPGTVFDGYRLDLADLRPANTLTVVAECTYSSTGEGLHRFVDPVDGGVYLATQFEPAEAHRVFGCFDQPDLKAPWTLTVHCPSDWVVVSTTSAQTVNAGGTTTWSFAPSARISTYLYAIAAGPYVHVDSEHDGIPLGLYCRASLREYLDETAIFTLTRQGFDYFRELFGQPYAFGKYDQVFVPEFNAGAMENVACVLISERALFRTQVSRTQAMRRAEVVLHELAHMWFGNLVTMRWWDDLWLNEAFATYVSVHALVNATEFTEAWTYFCDVAKTMARAEDQLPSTHPVVADARDIETAAANFDGITYAKGASVLRQLVAWVGEEAFFAGLRSYFDEHAWGNTELADLIRHLERSSGRALDGWSKEWLLTTGVNTLRGVITEGTVCVEQSGSPRRDHRVAVGRYQRDGDKLVRRERVEFDLSDDRHVVAGMQTPSPEELLVVNDDDLTYAKVRLDPGSWRVLIANIDRLDDSLARAVCWGAAWDMTRDAEVPATQYLELVLRGLPGERDLGVVERLLQQARTAALDFGDPECATQRLHTLSTAARERAVAVEPGSDLQRSLATAFIASAQVADGLQRILTGESIVPGLVVDQDMRWTILTRVAVLGAASASDIDAELARDDTADGRLRHLTALAARPTPAAKQWAWEKLTSPDLSHHAVMAVIAGFNQGEQSDLLNPYVHRLYDDLPTLWTARANASATAPYQVQALLPLWDSTPAGLARLDDVLAGPLPASLLRVIGDGRDTMARSLRCRALDTGVPA